MRGERNFEDRRGGLRPGTFSMRTGALLLVAVSSLVAAATGSALEKPVVFHESTFMRHFCSAF